jgi:hypothetical protein
MLDNRRDFTQLVTQHANRVGSLDANLNSAPLNRLNYDYDVPRNPNPFTDFSGKNQHPFTLLRDAAGAPQVLLE